MHRERAARHRHHQLRRAGLLGGVAGRAGRAACRTPTSARSSAAGGIAVLVPPLPPDADDGDARAVLARLDGLILAGGADVEPGALRRRRRTRRVQEPRPRPRRARAGAGRGPRAERGLPVLGVCRGMQVMAVAAGGDAGAAPARPASATTSTRRRPASYGRAPVRIGAGHAAGRGCSATEVDVADATTTRRCGAHPGYAADGLGRRRHARGDRGPGRAVPARRAVAPGGRGTTRGCSRRWSRRPRPAARSAVQPGGHVRPGSPAGHGMRARAVATHPGTPGSRWARDEHAARIIT